VPLLLLLLVLVPLLLLLLVPLLLLLMVCAAETAAGVRHAAAGACAVDGRVAADVGLRLLAVLCVCEVGRRRHCCWHCMLHGRCCWHGLQTALVV